MKNNKKNWYKYLITAGFFLVILTILGVIKMSGDFPGLENQEDVLEENVTASDETEEIETIAFPYELEDGKLSITSLFQSDVPNPDKDFEEGKNLATIEVLNQSNQYLLFADFVLTLVDGTQINFRAEDIPAGKKVWAFDLANASIDAEVGCVSIECTAEFAEIVSDWNTKFQTEADTSLVKITNLTDEVMKELEVTFHCLMEDTYFGGLSFKYSIDELLPQAETELEVIECYFGDAEVVLVEP